MRDFWADTSSEWAYRVSADGAYIAHSAVRRTQEVLLIKRASDMAELAAIPETYHYSWSDIAPELYIISHEERMWRVDPETPDRDAWVDVTPRGFSNWFVNTKVHGPDDTWTVTSHDRNPGLPDLYKVRQDGGGKELFLENEGHGINRWQNSLRHSRVVEDFLAKHLGGRSGGWDYIEIPAEYLD